MRKKKKSDIAKDDSERISVERERERDRNSFSRALASAPGG